MHRLPAVMSVRFAVRPGRRRPGRELGVALPCLGPSPGAGSRHRAIDAPIVELEDTDLAAVRWADQAKVDWILLISSLAGSRTPPGPLGHAAPAFPLRAALWASPDRAQTPAVARFVTTALTLEPPRGWHTQPEHLNHSSA